MKDAIITGIVSSLIASIVLATIATLVSNQSETAKVITQSGKSFAQILACAVSPITRIPCQTDGADPQGYSTSTISFPSSIESIMPDLFGAIGNA